MSETQYRTLVADPPWMPSLGGTWSADRDKGRGQRDYPLMTLDEIRALRPNVADQSHCYIWVVSQHVDWGYHVCESWGFSPVICWTWEKPGPGVGRFRCNTEQIVVGRRGSRHGNPFGSGGRHAQATSGTCFHWPRGRHSEKPAEFYSLVETLSPGPRLEMFARHPRDGWDVWGNEVESAPAALHQGAM
jgi:N6-adenosine-specific RNA methylase IME4